MDLLDEPQSLWIDAVRHPLGLRVHVRGARTCENTVAYWRAILRRLRLTGAQNVLLVDELDGDGLSESEWLGVMMQIAGMGPERIRIAHVKPTGMDDIACYERFVRDVGYEAKVFDREEDAERWLREG